MVYDGRDYPTATAVHSSLYNAGAPLVGASLSHALIAAYCYARNHGRRVLEQSYPFDFRDPSTALGELIQAATADTRIAEGRRVIPRGTTHLVAEVHFRVWSRASRLEAKHRVQVGTSGIDLDVGAYQTDAIEAPTPPGWFYRTPELAQDGFYRGASYVARCEVTLADVEGGEEAEIAVEGYLSDSEAGANNTAYTPHHVTVWAEVRG